MHKNVNLVQYIDKIKIYIYIYISIYFCISRLLEHNTLTDSARKILFGLYRSGTYVKPCFHTIFLCTLKLCNRLAS